MKDKTPFMYANSISAELMKSGDLDTVETICLKALDNDSILFLGNPKVPQKVKAMNYGMLGNIYFLRHKFDEAKEFYQKALQIFHHCDDQSEGIGITYSNLGLVNEAKGNLSEAIKNWEEALFMFSVIGDNWRSKETNNWINEVKNNK